MKMLWTAIEKDKTARLKVSRVPIWLPDLLGIEVSFFPFSPGCFQIPRGSHEKQHHVQNSSEEKGEVQGFLVNRGTWNAVYQKRKEERKEKGKKSERQRE